MVGTVYPLARAIKQEAPSSGLLPAATVFANVKNPFGKTKIPFGQFAPEDESLLHAPQCVRGSNIDIISGAWLQYLETHPSAFDTAGVLSQLLLGVSCSARELSEFIELRPTSQNQKDFSAMAGIFINALIRTGSDDCYVVRTDHLVSEIEYLVAYEGKRVIVRGNAGRLVGYSMSGGELIVEGDAGIFAGDHMGGGQLTILGSAGGYPGQLMNRGTLTICGSAGEHAGSQMSGGTLTIGGDAGSQAGRSISGGVLHIKGNAGECLGYSMTGGTITVDGDAGPDVGGGNWGDHGMTGGKIRIRGTCKGISDKVSGGRIYVGGIRIYPPIIQEVF